MIRGGPRVWRPLSWPVTREKSAAGQGTQSEQIGTGQERVWRIRSGEGRTTVKRSRRGGRRPQHGGNGGGGGGGNNGGGGGFNPNRTFDSSGPEIKIRGSASHVYEKYLQLARDANSGGDRVMAENYLQHAEHYYRIMAAANRPSRPSMPPSRRPRTRNSSPHGQQTAGQWPAAAAAEWQQRCVLLPDRGFGRGRGRRGGSILTIMLAKPPAVRVETPVPYPDQTGPSSSGSPHPYA